MKRTFGSTRDDRRAGLTARRRVRYRLEPAPREEAVTHGEVAAQVTEVRTSDVIGSRPGAGDVGDDLGVRDPGTLGAGLTVAAENPGRGRPPDPNMEAKVFRAALEVYVESGWVGFTIDAVAARGRVGKAAIYRRWASKEALLVAAIRAAAPETEPSLVFQAPLLRTNLVTYAAGIISALTRPLGLVLIRAQLEAKLFPHVLGVALEPIRTDWIKSARSAVADAIASGELPATASTAMIFDGLRGTIINHYLLMPEQAVPGFVENRHEYAERLVEIILGGASAELARDQRSTDRPPTH